MDVRKYFNTEVAYEEFMGVDETYREAKFGEPITLKVRVEGNTKYIRNQDNSMTVSEQSYWTTHSVKVHDRINNQIIISVKIIYDFNGEVVYYEAYV